MLHLLLNVADSFLRCMVRELEVMADRFFVTNVVVKDEYWHSFLLLFGVLIGAVGIAAKQIRLILFDSPE